jgi:hypothetical protein
MPINFPSSPETNQYFTSGGTTWIWDGSKWNIYLSPYAIYQASPPSGTIAGQIWIDSDDNYIHVWDGSEWVKTSGGAIYQSSEPTTSLVGQIWIDSNDDKNLYVWSGSSWVQISPDLSSYATKESPTFTGVSSFPDGSVSAPSITNIGDTNTGIFFPAEDTIAFSEGGVEAMRLDSSGRVIVPQQPSFWAYTTTSTGSGNVIVFPSTQHNVGSHYNSTNGRFTAPVSGRYFFSINSIGSTSGTTRIFPRVNGSSTSWGLSQFQLRLPNTSNYSVGNLNFIWNLAANDYIDLFVSENTAYSDGSGYMNWSGLLVG